MHIQKTYTNYSIKIYMQKAYIEYFIFDWLRASYGTSLDKHMC